MEFSDIPLLVLFFLLGVLINTIIFVNNENMLDNTTLDSVCKDKLGDSYKFNELYRDDNGIQHIKCIKEEKYQLDGSNNYIIKGD